MMNFIRQRFLTLRYTYPNPIDRQRARGLLRLVVGTIPVWLLIVFVTLLQASASGADEGFLTNFMASVTAPLFMLAIYTLVQRGRLLLASWMIVVVILAFSVLSVREGIYRSGIISLMISVVAAGLLLEARGIALALSVTVLAGLLGASIQADLTAPVTVIPASTTLFNLVVLFANLLVVAVLLLSFSDRTQGLAGQMAVAAEQLEQAGRFVTTANTADETVIYQQAMVFLREKLGFGLMQLYLADDSGKLVRRVRPGVGLRSVDVSTQAYVPESSALLEALRRRVTVTVAFSDPELRRTHLLVVGGFAAAVPLIWQEWAIGVLDVQTADEPFTREQIAVLEVIAGQVAALVAAQKVENALRSSLAEQQAILDGLRRQLRDSRDVDRRSVNATWDDYLTGRGQQAVGFDIDQAGHVSPAYDVPAALNGALAAGGIEVAQSGGSHIVNVPIVLRGEVLGAMAFTLPAGQVLTERQLDMAQKVADRLALALENKRLFEQTQAQVARERTANEATRLLITATDVETAIKLAADSFNVALGAVRTRVQLQPEAFREPPAPSIDGQSATARTAASVVTPVTPMEKTREEETL